MEIGRRPHASIPPGIEAHPRDRSRFVLSIESAGDRPAHQVDPSDDEGRDVGVYGVIEGRDEDAGRKRRRLVLVVDDLREPLHVELRGDVAGLGRVEHEPVPVVIVAGVRVIELGRRRLLEARAHVRHVPIGHEGRPVRVHVGDEQEDDVVANEAHLGRLCRDDLVGQKRGCLGVAHFCGVQSEVDPHDRFPVAGQGPRLFVGQVAPLGEPSGDLLIAVGVSQIGCRRDERHQLRPALGRSADFFQAEPRRRRIKRAEIGGDLFVGGQLVVGAGHESDDGFWRGNGGLRGRSMGGPRDQDEGYERPANEASHAGAPREAIIAPLSAIGGRACAFRAGCRLNVTASRCHGASAVHCSSRSMTGPMMLLGVEAPAVRPIDTGPLGGSHPRAMSSSVPLIRAFGPRRFMSTGR